MAGIALLAFLFEVMPQVSINTSSLKRFWTQAMMMMMMMITLLLAVVLAMVEIIGILVAVIIMMVIMMISLQETAEDHPHLNPVIAALGRVQNNGTNFTS